MKRFARKSRLWSVATCVVVLVVGVTATPAAAHVTIQPPESTTGAFARFVVRVPNEHESAATIKVEVEMPDAFEEVRYQPKQGWTRTLNGRTVVWEGGRIEHGEFDEFGFSTRMPNEAGVLTFPAIQTYENGEVVSWTGPEDADQPAGRVTVSKAPASAGDDSDGGDAATGGGGTDGGGGDGKGIAWTALGVSAVAVLVAGAGMVRGRKP
ncbi:MAG TPA: YcnI family protein [Acidimicrobiales bacterium]